MLVGRENGAGNAQMLAFFPYHYYSFQKRRLNYREATWMWNTGLWATQKGYTGT